MSKEQANATKVNTTAKRTKKVETTFADSWKPENEGEALAGVYLGPQKAVGDTGPFTAYHIRTVDGRRLSVSGAGLDTIMPQIPRKTEVTITYAGKEKKGKGLMRVYDVQVPDDVVLIDPFDDEHEE